jgi:hypothetical protein
MPEDQDPNQINPNPTPPVGQDPVTSSVPEIPTPAPTPMPEPAPAPTPGSPIPAPPPMPEPVPTPEPPMAPPVPKPAPIPDPVAAAPVVETPPAPTPEPVVPTATLPTPPVSDEAVGPPWLRTGENPVQTNMSSEAPNLSPGGVTEAPAPPPPWQAHTPPQPVETQQVEATSVNKEGGFPVIIFVVIVLAILFVQGALPF